LLDVDISGLTASVLKPQSEKEKQDIEKAMEKERKKRTGEATGLDVSPELMKKIGVGILSVIIILFLGFKLVSTSSKPADSAILEQDIVVYQNDVRLKVTTTTAIDKATVMIFKDEQKIAQESGKIVSNEDSTSKFWEFSASALTKGKYTYKCYAKNTAEPDKLSITKGNFTVK